MDNLSRRLIQLSKNELVQKILESEAALNEFQESSRDLERALEEELHELESTNVVLIKQLQNFKGQLNSSRQQKLDLGREVGSLQELIQEKDAEISHLRQKIVNIEILNDSMESQDRIMTSKYELQQSFNNELLEKLAILEDEVDRLRKLNIEKGLYITNYQNQIEELNLKVTSLESQVYKEQAGAVAGAGDSCENGDVSILSIKEMLKTTPPPKHSNNSTKNSNSDYPLGQIKKSDSLQKLKNLTRDIEVFLYGFNGQKNDSSNNTTTNTYTTATTNTSSNNKMTIFKSPSTIELNKHETPPAIRSDKSTTTTTTTTSNSNSNSIKRLSYNSQFTNLPSINGSPTTTKRITQNIK
ncbi:hypothetical protein KGF56_003181 [Candida oxycetoniae]|uniref:NUDE domain-containing protein n=1 Tax=Candida oxycetoniae TaxID=497107 RepID=A0AAI9SW27_9ASCO|nr:uncharacterized protein KGF56_003181 [Candida oxycetoniae]KAI3404022.2 hypothetical protein KGF56_003181 [Candida oxycetoniae]